MVALYFYHKVVSNSFKLKERNIFVILQQKCFSHLRQGDCVFDIVCLFSK